MSRERAMASVVSTSPVAHTDELLFHDAQAKPPSAPWSAASDSVAASMSAFTLAASNTAARASMRIVWSAEAWSHGVCSRRSSFRSALRESMDSRTSLSDLRHCSKARPIAGLAAAILPAASEENNCEASHVEVPARSFASPRSAFTTVHTGLEQYCRV